MGWIFLTLVKGSELHLRSPTSFENIWCAALGPPDSLGVPPVERRNWLGAEGLALSFSTPLRVLPLLRATPSLGSEEVRAGPAGPPLRVALETQCVL